MCGMYLYPYYHSYQALSIFGKSQSKFGFNSSEDWRGHCIASNMIIRPGKMKMGEIKYLPCSVYLDCWRLATPLVVSLCEPLGLSCWVEIISATQCLGKSIFTKEKTLIPQNLRIEASEQLHMWKAWGQIVRLSSSEPHLLSKMLATLLPWWQFTKCVTESDLKWQFAKKKSSETLICRNRSGTMLCKNMKRDNILNLPVDFRDCVHDSKIACLARSW